MRYTSPEVNEDGWTDWIRPVVIGYKMRCCDCDLVHDVEFKVTSNRPARKGEEAKVYLRVRRNMRATAASRRGR